VEKLLDLSLILWDQAKDDLIEFADSFAPDQWTFFQLIEPSGY
jgi:hypothetical protein